jgi:hypothetical protein
MQALSPSSIQAPVSFLEKTPGILEILLRETSKDLLHWKPAPERWSIAEVLAHLAEIERLYEQRAKKIIMEDNPNLTRYVPPDDSGVNHRPSRDHFQEFLALRRAFTIFLRSVPVASGSRNGTHPEMGTITLSQMLHELANHDLGHLRQIAELYRARCFYPHAGPFQRYSNPKP